MARLHHEQIFRGKEAMAKLASKTVHICGAGALGSNLAVNLMRSGFRKIVVIDKDRVEEQNIGTQVYSMDDVGGQKAELLRNMISRDLGEDITAHASELTAQNSAKLLKGAELVVDVFDNTASRKLIYDYCKEKNIHCLHAGVNESFGELRWNEGYRVPADAGLDVCDYPLARNLILMVVAIASELLVNFILNGEKRNYSLTLGDLRINHESD